MKEIYKELTEIITENSNKYYFDFYLVSNLGNIKNKKTNRILKQQKTQDGYSIVSLIDKDKKKRTLRVHRLVATVFIPNPNNLPQINHKNGDKSKNYVNNLEWCSSLENVRHMVKNNLSNFKEKLHEASINGKITGIKQPKKVKIIHKDTKKEYTFDSCAEAARFIGATNGSSISRVANGERNICKGYYCKYI